MNPSEIRDEAEAILDAAEKQAKEEAERLVRRLELYGQARKALLVADDTPEGILVALVEARALAERAASPSALESILGKSIRHLGDAIVQGKRGAA